MKPTPFEYHRAYTPEETVATLTELGEDAKILAGGQSLAPMMNFRLARPTALVDVNPIRGLDYIRRTGDELAVGALTRHRSMELCMDPGVLDGFSVLPRAARWIGHYPIRSRGTVGGSIAHADPTAEWCLLARLYDADVVLLGPDGRRREPSAGWFTGFLSTTAASNEMVVEIRFTRPRAYGALTEYARRRGDFAVAAVAVAFDILEGRCRNVSIALGGVASTTLRATEAEGLAEGATATDQTWREVARAAAAGIDPPADLNGDAHYRRRLVQTLTERAFAEALAAGLPQC